MNDAEQNFIALAAKLVVGLKDMIAAYRLTEADMPDDWEWLQDSLKGLSDEQRAMQAYIDAEDCEG